MAQKFVLEFEEKHHILEVDGIEYEVPQRTAEIENKIKEHDEALSEHTEYENNMSILEILFGKKAAKTMFPDTKSTNLDKLSKCAKIALAAYYSALNEAKSEELTKSMEKLKPYVNNIDKAMKSINQVNTANFVKNKKK